MNLIEQLEQEEIARLTANRKIPDFQPGDTVVVQAKVKEGNRERLQAYEGVVIAKRQALAVRLLFSPLRASSSS